MQKFIQIHTLTYVPPANMNRDENNRPKVATIGRETRLRISSQSLKRSWRTSELFETRLAGHLGERTQRMGMEIMSHLTKADVPEDKAREVAREVAAVFGKVKEVKEPREGASTDKPNKKPREVNTLLTEQLAFISSDERAAALAYALDLARNKAPKGKAADLVLRTADGSADVAMFGRMYADNPGYNREAAVQVAHSLTTHRVHVDSDYYVAIDDLKPASEDVGAGFMGNLAFGAGVFYGYACIDTELLLKNLAGDASTARASVEALVEAVLTVFPAAKRAAFGSFPLAGYAMVERGSAQPRTLGAAYSTGIEGDLMEASVAKLRSTVEGFDAAYGARGVERLVMDARGGAAKTASMADLIAFSVAA